MLFMCVFTIAHGDEEIDRDLGVRHRRRQVVEHLVLALSDHLGFAA
jgi:hypothetical protein